MKLSGLFIFLFMVSVTPVNILFGGALYSLASTDSALSKSAWISPGNETILASDSSDSASKGQIITLTTFPDDAEVLAEGKLIGRTPTKISYLSKLTLRKKGYAEKEIYPYRTNQIQNYELVRLIPSHKESFFQTNTFTLVSAAIIVLGGTAAYLKIEADSQFEQYQNTGNESYLSQTRKYDLYSGLAFGVMQVNFGYLVYKFLVSP